MADVKVASRRLARALIPSHEAKWRLTNKRRARALILSREFERRVEAMVRSSRETRRLWASADGLYQPEIDAFRRTPGRRTFQDLDYRHLKTYPELCWKLVPIVRKFGLGFVGVGRDLMADWLTPVAVRVLAAVPNQDGLSDLAADACKFFDPWDEGNAWNAEGRFGELESRVYDLVEAARDEEEILQRFAAYLCAVEVEHQSERATARLVRRAGDTTILDHRSVGHGVSQARKELALRGGRCATDRDMFDALFCRPPHAWQAAMKVLEERC